MPRKPQQRKTETLGAFKSRLREWRRATDPDFKRRSDASLKSWKVRELKAQRRSDAAKLGWDRRRARETEREYGAFEVPKRARKKLDEVSGPFDWVIEEPVDTVGDIGK